MSCPILLARLRNAGGGPGSLRGRTIAPGPRLALLLLALAAGALPVAAQESPAAASEPTVQPAVQPVVQADLPSADASDPLPAPRMDRAYAHVFLAFGIAWLLIFGYVWALNRRIAAAEKDLARLAERGG